MERSLQFCAGAWHRAWPSETGAEGLRSFNLLLALVTAGLGLALLVVTAVHGGGETGYLLGVLFVGAGAGRLYLTRRRSR